MQLYLIWYTYTCTNEKGFICCVRICKIYNITCILTHKHVFDLVRRKNIMNESTWKCLQTFCDNKQ